jgi:predicted amidophosphoribosyltransferase
MGVLAELISPARCIACGRSGPLACSGCRSSLGPAPAGELVAGIDRVVSAWVYEGIARSLVLGLKLSGREACADPLSLAVASSVLREGLRADLLTWVPARTRDVRRRGFDHAEVLARRAGRLLGLPVRGLLVRQGSARDQAGLSRAERAQNLQGEFQARSGGPARVALVDDLITTGATAKACAEALSAEGYARIELLTPCRA